MFCFISTCVIIKINHLYVIKTTKSNIAFFLYIINEFFKKWWDKKIETLEKDVLKTSKINQRKELFKELPFYNVPIDKQKIKKLTNVEMLSELPLFN